MIRQRRLQRLPAHRHRPRLRPVPPARLLWHPLPVHQLLLHPGLLLHRRRGPVPVPPLPRRPSLNPRRVPLRLIPVHRRSLLHPPRDHLRFPRYRRRIVLLIVRATSPAIGPRMYPVPARVSVWHLRVRPLNTPRQSSLHTHLVRLLQIPWPHRLAPPSALRRAMLLPATRTSDSNLVAVGSI